jgi:hypothetical protein
VGAGEAREQAARLVDLAVRVEVRQPVLQVEYGDEKIVIRVYGVSASGFA